MKRLLTIGMALMLILATLPASVLAYDEQPEEASAVAEEVLFTDGYVVVEKGTAAFDEVKGEEAGVFPEESVVFAETITDEEDWYKVFFEPESGLQDGEDYLALFVKAEDCEVLESEEAESLTKDIKSDSKYGNNVLTVAAFEAAEAEAEEAAPAEDEEAAEEAEEDSAEAAAPESGKKNTEKASLAITSSPSDVTIGAGKVATFQVSASGEGLTYQWQYRASSSGTWANTNLDGAKTPTLSITARTEYNGRQFRCTVKDKYYNSITTGPATLYVVSGPAITSNPSSVTTSVGLTAKFKISATGEGLIYQWQYRTSSSGSWANTSVTGAKTATMSITARTEYSGRQFRCIVKDKYGNYATSSAATLTVVAAPKITSNPSSVTTSVGLTATYKVSATGTGLTYQWQYRPNSSGTWANTSVTGAKTATMSITARTEYSGRQFRCVVKDKYGNTVTSSAANLTVVAAPKITSNPTSVTTSEGLTASFKITATGSGLIYQWQYRTSSSGSWANTSVTGAKTATMSITARSEYSGRQFRCIVKDQYGNYATSNAATLTVVAAPKITSNPSSVSTSDGNTATFKVTATGTSLTYQWQYRPNSSGTWANTSLGGAKTATLSFTARTDYNGRQFRCVVKDKYGNTATSNAATLTVTQSTKYRALLIGNNYEGTSSQLGGCINDSTAMEGMLKSLKNKYTVTRKNEATGSTILNSIPTAFSGATSNDVSLFYYSGHGVYDFEDWEETIPTEYTGALCGVDCDYTDDGYVTMAQLAAKLSNVPGKIIVILDSCHSGAAIGKGKNDARSKEQLKKFNQSVIDAFSGYKLETPGDGHSKFGELAQSKFIVITAATYTRSSYDMGDRGQFTSYFLDGIGAEYPDGAYTGYMPADTNGDSQITLYEGYKYANDAVTEDCEYWGDTNPSPQYYGTGSFVMFRR